MSVDPTQLESPGGAVAPNLWRSALAHPRAHIVKQFLRFATVGVSNTLLALAIYTVLVEVFGVWYLLASAIGFIAGAVNGFLLNRAWTFRGHRGDALTPVRWAVVQSCGLALDEALLFLCVKGAGLDELVAQAVAIAIVVLATFAANRAWTFRAR